MAGAPTRSCSEHPAQSSSAGPGNASADLLIRLSRSPALDGLVSTCCCSSGAGGLLPPVTGDRSRRSDVPSPDRACRLAFGALLSATARGLAHPGSAMSGCQPLAGVSCRLAQPGFTGGQRLGHRVAAECRQARRFVCYRLQILVRYRARNWVSMTPFATLGCVLPVLAALAVFCDPRRWCRRCTWPRALSPLIGSPSRFAGCRPRRSWSGTAHWWSGRPDSPVSPLARRSSRLR